MPFTCKTIQEAASGDVVTNPHVPPPDGKYQVIFPVGLPDEGAFEWADNFMATHPDFTELSDRTVLEWAASSNLFRHQGYAWKASNDKPEMNFNIPQMDDYSIQRVLSHVAPTQQRNLLVMEVRANLMKDDRIEALKRFCHAHFKKVATVIVGEPSKDIKRKAYAELLAAKQEAMDKEYQARMEEKQRARMVKKHHRMLERERRKREREAKRVAAAVAKRANAEEEAAKAAAVAKAKEDGTDATDAADGKEEEKKASEAAKDDIKPEEEDEEEPEEPEEEEPEDTEMRPVAKLTESEKKNWFRKPTTPDLTPWSLSSSFAKFSLPTKDEGFDEVRYEWMTRSKSTEYARTWIMERKLSTRIEDIQPSDWFRLRYASWQVELKKWHQALTAGKEPASVESTPASAENTRPPENGSTADQDQPETEKAAGQPVSDVAGDAMDVDDLDADVFAIQDVLDIGKGEPLFTKFEFEDWALMSLRFELSLLVHAFRHDVEDPERLGITPDNLSFYYSRYFRKALNTSYYGVESIQQLLGFIRDTVSFDAKHNVLVSHLSSELDRFDLFVKLTEECRRERALLIDGGDETLRLKFSKPPAPAQGDAGMACRSAPYGGGGCAPPPTGYSGGKGYAGKSQNFGGGKTGAAYGKSGHSFGGQVSWDGGGAGSYGGPPAAYNSQQGQYYNKGGNSFYKGGGKNSYGTKGSFERTW